MKRLLGFILQTGGWAPALVLILHQFLHSKEWRNELDWFNHFSGGLSFSFFAFKSMPLVYRWLGTPTAFGRLVVTFLSGCTAALMWEIVEFSSDLFLGTHIQKSIQETMMDIVNGFLGTTAVVLISTVFTYRRARKAALV